MRRTRSWRAPRAAWSSVQAARGRSAPAWATYDRAVAGSGILGSLVGGDVAADADGGFRVGGLVPDTTIVLRAELDGRFSDTVTFRVSPGMMRTGIVLRMQ